MGSIRDQLLDFFEQFADDDTRLIEELQGLIAKEEKEVYTFLPFRIPGIFRLSGIGDLEKAPKPPQFFNCLMLTFCYYILYVKAKPLVCFLL
jgi:hypothetical protein